MKQSSCGLCSVSFSQTN